MTFAASNAWVSSGLLDEFRQGLLSNNPLSAFREGLVGADAVVDGPFGRHDLVYADYVASGRALWQIEKFILERVLPYYANSHTEASYCGGMMTRLRREARATIATHCGASAEHAVIFAGSGATAGLNRLVSLLGVASAVAAGRKVRILIGPYEHHSNILPWRESGAAVVEISESEAGGPDLTILAEELAEPADLIVCSFSVASNVTGIITDVAAVTRMVKAAGARMVWDYAGAGPYLPITMSPEIDAPIDAVVISPHKFIGGPGASGVLILRHDVAATSRPSWPGGGTVRFVSSTGHDYSDSLEAREEAGTPNVIGDIRAALAFIVKDVIGDKVMHARNVELVERAVKAWDGIERMELLGRRSAPRLPIFSFRVCDGKGGYVHQQLVTRMLSDRFGIQARGGCACAGPYVHRLLSIDADQSSYLRASILEGKEMLKPGFTRVNFSVLLTDEKVQYILESIAMLASDAPGFEQHYEFDAACAIFYPRETLHRLVG